MRKVEFSNKCYSITTALLFMLLITMIKMRTLFIIPTLIVVGFELVVITIDLLVYFIDYMHYNNIAKKIKVVATTAIDKFYIPLHKEFAKAEDYPDNGFDITYTGKMLLEDHDLDYLNNMSIFITKGDVNGYSKHHYWLTIFDPKDLYYEHPFIIDFNTIAHTIKDRTMPFKKVLRSTFAGIYSEKDKEFKNYKPLEFLIDIDKGFFVQSTRPISVKNLKSYDIKKLMVPYVTITGNCQNRIESWIELYANKCIKNQSKYFKEKTSDGKNN